jgi:hypothetical protein
MTNRFAISLTGAAGVPRCRFAYTDTVLKSHKGAVAEIKPAQQRVEKAKQGRDKLKEKLES